MKRLLFSICCIFLSIGSFSQNIITTLPYSESFDNYEEIIGVTNFFPSNWCFYAYNIPYNAPHIVGEYAYSAPRSLSIKPQSSACLPWIDNSIPIDSLKVKFKVFFTSPNSSLKICLGNGIDFPEFYTTIVSITSTELFTWQEYEIWFDTCNNLGRNIIFSVFETSNLADVFIDDVKLSAIPTCIKPSNLIVSDLSSGSATIGFTAQNNENQWVIQYKSSFDSSWASATTINNVTTNPYTISGLNSSTAYDLRVKSVCSSTDESEWSYSNFHTSITSFPFYDSFDNYGTGINIMPYGWSKISNSISTISSVYTYNYSPPGGLIIFSDTINNYVISPKIDTSIQLNSLRLKFQFNVLMPESKLVVGVMSNPTDTNTFVQIEEISSELFRIWEEKEVLLNSYNGNDKYIAFKTPANSQVVIDNLEISTIPTCIKPNNITLVSVSPTSASFSFNPRNNETNWEVQYKNASDTSWVNSQSINITSNPFTINSLTNPTAYDLRIRAVCSSTDNSEWTYYSFFTSILNLPWVESFDSYGTEPYVFPAYKNGWTKILNLWGGSAYISSGGYSLPGALRFQTSLDSAQYVVSPKIDNSILINTLRAKFKLKIQNSFHKLVIGVMSDPNDTSTFVQIEELSMHEANTWKDKEVQFNFYNGNGQYIAFKSSNTSNCNIYIDDFELLPLPSCLKPTNLDVSKIVNKKAKVTWNDNNNSAQWEIEYKPYYDTTWENAVRISNITTSPFTITNLPQSIVLSLRIRNICSLTDSSEWTYYDSPIYAENIDFSYGNFINWKAYTALNNSYDFTRSFTNWTLVISDTNNLISGNTLLKICSDTTENDIHVQNLKTIPFGYNHSVKINYDTINNWSYSSKASKLIYDMDVDYSNFLLTLNYTIVYRKSGYPNLTGPSYTLEVVDLIEFNGQYVEGSRVLPEAYYDTIGSYDPMGWNSTDGSFTDRFNWKPWTKMELDLSSKIGQKVRVKVITSKANNNFVQSYSYLASKIEGLEQGTCYPPLLVNVDSVGNTSAKISFDKTFPTDSNWILQYREIGNIDWNYIYFDTNDFVISNLSPNSNYEAFIQTLCSDSTYSDSSFVFNFTTPIFNIDSTFNNQTVFLCGKYFYDDGGEGGNYSNNTNYTFTVCPTRKTNDPFSINRASVYFEDFSLGQGDVLRAFSGRSINPQTQLSIGNIVDFTGNFLDNKTLIANLSDTSGCITFNFVTYTANSSNGFKAYVDCIDRCQRVIADLDTFFIKYDSLGNTSNHLIKTINDSVFSNMNNSWFYNNYRSIDICEGDQIRLVAKPQFPDNNSHYNQSINNCIYYWNFGDLNYDTINFNNLAEHDWEAPIAYNLELKVLDTSFSYLNNIGCKSENSINTMIRILKNPIIKVKAPVDICSGTPFVLNVGYDTNSTILIDSIKIEKKESGLFDSIVIIPDGPYCSFESYESSIFFNEFLPNNIFDNVNDLKSICINMEHSFVGDLKIELICPSGQNVILKHNTHQGGADFGIPSTQSVGCDMSPSNLPGIGWNYCFSNLYLDNPRGVISGNMPSPIDSSNTINKSKFFQTPVQAATNISSGWETTDLNGFNSLIGCPMNGEWKLKITDYWAADNGFVFKWKLDLGQMSSWDYQSSFDTVIVEGLNNYSLSNDTVVITPLIDTAGLIRYGVNVIDEFGCVWDTATYMNVAQSPIFSLGNDTSSCEPFNVLLDCGISDAKSYLWLPSGDTTQTIIAESLTNPNSSISYIAQVTNYNGSIYCSNLDTINLIVGSYPTTPTNLNIQTQSSSFNISWQGNGLSYEVFRNDTLIATTDQCQYIDSNVAFDVYYCYKIISLNDNCESDVSNQICKTFSDLNTITPNTYNVSLYPNPAMNKTTLKIDGLENDVEVHVYDFTGRIINTYIMGPTQSKLEIDLKNYIKGIYNIKIINSTINITKKLIVY